MSTTPEHEAAPEQPPLDAQAPNAANGDAPGAEVNSAGISISGNASVQTINAQTVVGRDYVVVTEEQSFDVADIPTNPYRGLASFTYKERAFYGGRDAQIRDALAMLTTPGDQRVLLLVTGASGSGKSSFVQAGLVPALEDYYGLHGNPRVVHTVLRPGRFPLAALNQALTDIGLKPSDAETPAAVLARTPPDQVNVIVLDQFEELFTQSESSDREAVCALLSSLGSFKELRTHLLLTLRSDYLGALFGVKPLYDLSKHSSIELRAMTATELAEAIRTPLDELNRQLGTRKRWDPALVQKLCEDVGTDATLLPLLQVTLTSLWEDPPRRLVLGRYRNLTTALQSTADRVYEQDVQGHARPQAERDTIMSIFIDLVEVSMDDDARRDVRRTMPRLALVRDRPERGPLIDELVDKRLLSSSGGPSDEARIDIIHETLLTNWSVLKAAIARQREALQSRERFLDAKREWLDHDRSDDYRLQGVYLAEARALVAAGDIVTHDADARAFIERSVAIDEEERQRELEQARALAAEQQARADDSVRAARRLRRWLVVVVVTALLAVGAAVVAAFAFVAANQQAQINKSRELAAEAQSQLAIAPEVGILLAREAEQRAPTQQAADALRQALVSSPIRRVLAGPGAALNGVALSPDGSLVAASGLDGSVRVWRMDSGAVAADFRAGDAPLATLWFNADGQTLLTAGANDPSVQAWNASTGARVATYDSGAPGVSAAAASTSGRLLAAGGKDGRVRVWDARSGQVIADLGSMLPLPVGALAFSPDEQRLAIAALDGGVRVLPIAAAGSAMELRGHSGPVMSVGFSPSGDQLVSAGFDGAALVWDPRVGRTRQELRGGTGPLSTAAFSPDGRTVLTADQDGHAWLWSAEDGRQLHELRGHAQRISTATFSPSGAEVLTTSDDASARLWDVASGSEVLRLRGHSMGVASAQFSRDGRTVVTASFDKSVRVWAVDQTPSWTVLAGHTAQVLGVALASDGSRVATASQDNSVRVWQPGLGSVARRDFATAASGVAFSPDGARLAFGLWDGSVHVSGADLAADSVLGSHADWIYSVAWSPDGTRLLSASKDRTARIWNVATGQAIGDLRGHTSDVTSAAWDVAGRRIVTTSVDKTARVWNADTLAQVAELRGHTEIVRRAAFSPDGRRVVTVAYDATGRVWDADTGREVTTLRGHTAPVLAVAFSPDGKLLATGSVDRSVIIWDTATWQPITSILGAEDDVDDLVFSRDGATLVAASGDGKARLYSREWFAPIAEVLDLSVLRVTRQPPALTADERGRFVHD